MKVNKKEDKPCKHKNRILKSIWSTVTIEQLVNYCPDCGKTQNLRYEN